MFYPQISVSSIPPRQKDSIKLIFFIDYLKNRGTLKQKRSQKYSWVIS